MSNLFGHKSAAVTQQVYTGIQVSTSLQGASVPLVYGMTRVPMNLIWYGNFVATQQKQSGGKGGGGGGSGSYTYSASFAAALCEGPINGIGQIFHDRSIVTLAYEDLTLFLGAGGQPAWTIPPAAQQVPYDHIAYVASPTYNLGGSASMPNLNFEVQGLLYNTGPPGPTFGGTFTGDVQSGSDVISNVATPGALNVGSIISDSSGAIPSGTTVVSLSPLTLSQPASSTVHGDVFSYTVIGSSAGDADASLVLTDYLTDPNHGAGYVGTIQPLTDFKNYVFAMSIGVSPVESTQRQANDFLKELMQICNCELVESAGTLRVVPYADAAVSGNGYTYDPTSTQLTPLFSFTDDDYIHDTNADPVELIRVPLKDTYNRVQVEYLDRSFFYNTAPLIAFDEDDANANGVRVAPTYTFHQITNATTARTVAQSLLQKSLYRRNSYRFKVRADYCLLEPMDPVAITDSGLGLVAQLCWITQITDTGDNVIEIEALEVTGIANTTPLYHWESAQGYAENYNTSPGPVSAPHIFMMPPYLAGDQAKYSLGIAVCGLSNSAAWGGCDVFASFDNVTYGFIGTVTLAARYGTLSSGIASGADPDTVNTLALSLANTTQTIAAATVAECDDMQALILVDDATNGAEVFSYSAATMVSAGNYNLGTYLRRGQYQTAINAHASGVPWVRMDDAIFQLPVDPGRLGDILYLKFCSFNKFGQARQTLADVPNYQFSLVSGALNPALNVVTTGSAIAFDYHVAKASTGASLWDSTVYSKVSFQACSATLRPQGSVGRLMLGLSTNPFSPPPGAVYISANYALYTDVSNTLRVYESGNPVAVVGTWALGDALSITYDGSVVRYFHNSAVVYETQAVGLTLYLFIPLFDPGVVASDVVFTQLSKGQNAATWISRGSGGVQISGNALQSYQSTNGYGIADAITQQIYQNGATFSCRFTVGAAALAGLVAGPQGGSVFYPYTTTPQNFLWYAHNDVPGSEVVVHENGTDYLIEAGPVLATDVFAVEYDGFYVRYYRNGVLKRTSVPSPGLSLCGYFTSFEPGNHIVDAYFASVPQATPWGWEATGHCAVDDASISKASGTNAWDSGAFTLTGYRTGHLVAKPNSLSDTWAAGFSTHPTDSPSYANLDYCWLLTGGVWYIYQSGTPIVTAGTAQAGDVVSMTYDGANVVYYLNAVLIDTSSAPGKTIYGQVAIYNPGGAINSLKFGAGATAPLTDTGQINAQAATDVVSTFITGPTNVYEAYTGPFPVPGVLIASVTVPPQPYNGAVVVVTANGVVDYNETNGQSSTYALISTASSFPGAFATSNTIARNPNNTTPTARGTFTIEQEFSLPANTAVTYYLYAGAGYISGSAGSAYSNLDNVIFKAEVIKR